MSVLAARARPQRISRCSGRAKSHNNRGHMTCHPGLIPDVNLVVVEGGPHAIPWTHTDEVNAALLRFLGHPAA